MTKLEIGSWSRIFRPNWGSCETVALWENCVGRPESYMYDSFSAKSCVFLVHELIYISTFQHTICPKARYNFFFMFFTYYSCTISLPNNVSLPFVSHDQTLKSQICQMLRQKIKVGIFKVVLDDIRYLQG
jgi:hypothetical protein